ncbi:structure-specific endonuclease subunit slx1 isoform X2 [Apis dorsata]|uniref:structure-specific endonuclease subunit slx1 isoform X2 n=1 Tax=Apis dorsata TaxID=7462 RepID=UPI001293FEEF|nr:structure-specific endonuclease subunit slx1 isoform X2 [Apis dorsata]
MNNLFFSRNMVLIIHGFLNKTSALSFEWAWQHPHKSRRLKHIYISNAKKKLQQKRKIRFHLSVLSEMLKIGPWCRLPLTIRWLDYEFYEEYYRYVSAPMHMPICYGKIISKKIKQTNNIQASDKLSIICFLCNSLLEKEQSISCIRPNCSLVVHLICLAQLFCKNNMILPIEGICPACNINVLWGDLIRKKIGCYGNLEKISNDENYT